MHLATHNLGQRQRLAVKLATDGQRQRVQHHERRWDHVIGQAFAQRGAQQRGIGQRAPAGLGQIGHQARLAGNLAHHHRCLANARQRAEHGCDLARLDAEAPKLDLVIGAPPKLDRAVSAPAAQIACTVHPCTRRAKRTGNEPLSGQTRAPRIPPRQTSTRNVQLPPHTHRNNR